MVALPPKLVDKFLENRDQASSLHGMSPSPVTILDTKQWTQGLGHQKSVHSVCKPKVLPLGVSAMLLPYSEKQKAGRTPGLCLGTTINKVETERVSQKYKLHEPC